MGIPLLGSQKWSTKTKKSTVWPHKLHALGGAASYEYVDAIGGTQANGEFSIIHLVLSILDLQDMMGEVVFLQIKRCQFLIT